MKDSDRPFHRIMDTNGEALAAVAEVIASARQEIMIFDRTPATLRERDIGRPESIDTIRTMLLGGKFRKLRVVLQELQGIETELPRLTALLAQFGGQIAIHRAIGAARDVQDVLVLADAHSVWRKPVHTHPRSILDCGDEASVKPYLERFEEIWINSELAINERHSGL